MSSFKAIAPSTPGIVPDIAGDFIKNLEIAVNAVLKLAIKVHAEKPDLVILISPEQPILHHRFAISKGPVVRAFSSNIDDSKHIELEFPCDTEFVEQLVERAFNAKIQMEEFTQEEGVVALDNASLGIAYFLHHIGVDVPMILIGISDLSLKTHQALGKVIEETLAVSEKHAAIIGVGAYDTTSLYTETFLDVSSDGKKLGEYYLSTEPLLLENTATSLLHPLAILSGMEQMCAFHDLGKQPLGEEGYLTGYFDAK